ncbi:MAG: CpsD/CapB family tyrosine-protein kinase [Caulobacteraceae bacterium]
MNGSSLFTIIDPKSYVSEAYRLMRINIMFSRTDKRVKTIVVTGANLAEGKSTVAANYAITLAHADSKVLVIDCDLRKPTIHKKFGLANRIGLTNILAQNLSPRKNMQVSVHVPNLYFITSGPIPPNPSELIGSDKMKNLISDLYEEYDYIIMDTPPVGVVTDAALLSSGIDGVVLVLESGRAEIEAAQRAKALLNNVKANILGVVINKIEAKNSGYYKYYYKEENEASALKKKVRYINEKSKVINYD